MPPGNGALALLFHVERLRCTFPEAERSAPKRDAAASCSRGLRLALGWLELRGENSDRFWTAAVLLRFGLAPAFMTDGVRLFARVPGVQTPTHLITRVRRNGACATGEKSIRIEGELFVFSRESINLQTAPETLSCRRQAKFCIVIVNGCLAQFTRFGVDYAADDIYLRSASAARSVKRLWPK